MHVFNGEVIDVQRKARKIDVPDEEINWLVRSHDNGFIYAREGVERVPYLNRLKELALETAHLCSLSFGAVDIIYNQEGDRCYVLEINSAPGLEGTTLERYCEAMRRI